MAVVLCILQACKQANITQTQHDGAGRPTEVIGAVVSDGYGNSASPVTQTIYDAAGNVASTIRSHK